MDMDHEEVHIVDEEDLEDAYVHHQHKVLKKAQQFKGEGSFLEDKSRVSQEQPDVVDEDIDPWKRLISVYGPSSFFDLPALANSARVTCFFLLMGNLYWLIVTLGIVTTNTTTVESLIKGKNPYKLPTVRQNWTQMMGTFSLWMLLPVCAVGRSCDGTQFPIKTSTIQASSTIL